MIKISDVSLYNLLPPSLQTDPATAAAARSLDSELNQLADQITLLSKFSRLDELTSEETDELAWQYNVPFYDPTLPLSLRREIVKNSFRWHRSKGTPAAVEELMTTIFGDGIVEEWFEYGGQPGYFRVITSNFSATTEHAERFLRLVNSVKNARSWLDTVLIRLVEDTQFNFGTAVYMADKIQITQEDEL